MVETEEKDQLIDVSEHRDSGIQIEASSEISNQARKLSQDKSEMQLIESQQLSQQSQEIQGFQSMQSQQLSQQSHVSQGFQSIQSQQLSQKSLETIESQETSKQIETSEGFSTNGSSQARKPSLPRVEILQQVGHQQIRSTQETVEMAHEKLESVVEKSVIEDTVGPLIGNNGRQVTENNGRLVIGETGGTFVGNNGGPVIEDTVAPLNGNNGRRGIGNNGRPNFGNNGGSVIGNNGGLVASTLAERRASISRDTNTGFSYSKQSKYYSLDLETDKTVCTFKLGVFDVSLRN